MKTKTNMERSSQFDSSPTTCKLSFLKSTLQQSLTYCQDLVKQFEDLYHESEVNKKKLISQKEICDSKQCSSSQELKKDIESKNNIIQSVASTLTKLYETKDFEILNEVFQILCGDKPITINELDHAVRKEKINVKKEFVTPKKEFFTPTKELFSPEKVLLSPVKDILAPLKDESVSEIEGTPTGRTSPIIQSRKIRNGSTANSSDFRDKKKCPDNWHTPEKKALKLTYPSPSNPKNKSGINGRLRQSRLNLIKIKPNNVVDLTSSPELMSMDRNSQNNCLVEPLVKKESTDNDDTILPSPTSGPNNFISLRKATSMISPIKFKKPPLCLKTKTEVKTPAPSCDIENNPLKVPVNNGIGNQSEDSINLLKPIRFLNVLDENSPIKVEPIDDDVTHCDIPSSLSILERVDILEQNQNHDDGQKAISPCKKPLAENKNFGNVPTEEPDSSISLLARHKVSPTEEKTKRTLSCKRPIDPAEPLYKEQVPRTKVDKRKLPGWNCDECKNFYDELYQNDPEMLAKKMDECSKHRGRNNPARPKTPEGFWNPRWSVPHDTEEFNKRNNAN